MTAEELSRLSEEDPELTPEACRRILARLNAKSSHHIFDDIRSHRPLRVPNHFAAYKHWTPLPQRLPRYQHVAKLILIVQSFHFLGWYEGGQRLGDTEICIGRPGEETRLGTFKILEKDADHFSRSYTDALGHPAWMPWALRIYGGVWIHAGDLPRPDCSHGCVILPPAAAEELFSWADPQTMVVIVDALEEVL